MSREFSRQVDIPPNIDPQSLRSTLSNDGILQVSIIRLLYFSHENVLFYSEIFCIFSYSKMSFYARDVHGSGQPADRVGSKILEIYFCLLKNLSTYGLLIQ